MESGVGGYPTILLGWVGDTNSLPHGAEPSAPGCTLVSPSMLVYSAAPSEQRVTERGGSHREIYVGGRPSAPFRTLKCDGWWEGMRRVAHALRVRLMNDRIAGGTTPI